MAVNLAIAEEKSVSTFIENLKKGNPQDCSDLVKDTGDRLKDSQSKLKQLSNENFSENVSDAQTWVSAGASNQDTCLSGLEEGDTSANLMSSVKNNTKDLTMLVSDVLTVFNTLKQQGRIG